MRTTCYSVLVLVLVSLSATSVRADTAAEAEEMIVIVEKLVGALVDGNGDCDKMAAAASRILDEKEATIKAWTEKRKKLTAGEKKALEEKYSRRLGAVMKKLRASGVEKCEGNGRCEKVMHRMQQLLVGTSAGD